MSSETNLVHTRPTASVRPVTLFCQCQYSRLVLAEVLADVNVIAALANSQLAAVQAHSNDARLAKEAVLALAHVFNVALPNAKVLRGTRVEVRYPQRDSIREIDKKTAARSAKERPVHGDKSIRTEGGVLFSPPHVLALPFMWASSL